MPLIKRQLLKAIAFLLCCSISVDPGWGAIPFQFEPAQSLYLFASIRQDPFQREALTRALDWVHLPWLKHGREIRSSIGSLRAAQVDTPTKHQLAVHQLRRWGWRHPPAWVIYWVKRLIITPRVEYSASLHPIPFIRDHLEQLPPKPSIRYFYGFVLSLKVAGIYVAMGSTFLVPYQAYSNLIQANVPTPISLAMALVIVPWIPQLWHVANLVGHSLVDLTPIPLMLDDERPTRNFEHEVNFLLGFVDKTSRDIYEPLLKDGPEAARKKITETATAKGDDTPVTNFDVEIERQFREAVATEFPNDGVLAEEMKDLNQARDRMWTLDPIDGTRDFLSIGEHFGTLGSYYENKQPRVAVGYWPRLNVDGSGSSLLMARADRSEATLNGQVVKAKIAEINESKTVIIGAHPSERTEMVKALTAFFEARGFNVVRSQASGGEVADMMLRGSAHLFIHLTPAGVDAPTNAFLAQKLGLSVSDRNGTQIFPFDFQNLGQGLFFDSLVIGTEESHFLAIEAFREIGEPEEPLPWTDLERTLEPVQAIGHFNQLMTQGQQRVQLTGQNELKVLKRKKAAKKTELRKQMEEAVARTTEIIREKAESDLELLVQEDPFRRAVLDPDKGALKQVVEIFKNKSRTGRSTMVGEGGPPGAGKTMGGKGLAAAVARLTKTRVPVMKEDNFLLQRSPVNRRGRGLEGKFQWDKRQQAIDDLGAGHSVLISLFDDVSGGNPLCTLNQEGHLVILNGDRTITITFTPGGTSFSYKEIMRRPGEEPVDLTARRLQRHTNISDSGVFVCGSTKLRIRIDERGRLVVGVQGIEVVDILDGEPILIDQLTDHIIDWSPDGNHAQATIPIPEGREHPSLLSESSFEIGRVEDPLDPVQLRAARELKQFLPAGTPVVYEGQFAFLRWENGHLLRKADHWDVALNYRAPRFIRWIRDMLRSWERGRTEKQVEENVQRFAERFSTEEEISVPAGVTDPKIVQVNTTDRAESMQRLVYYGQEMFSAYRHLFEQMGVDPRSIEEQQRKEFDEPVLLKMLSRWRDTLTFVRTLDGVDEYSIGPFLLRVAKNQESLAGIQRQQNTLLRHRTNQVMACNSLIDLTSLGPLGNGKVYGWVSLWNQAPVVGDRLTELAQRGDTDSLAEGRKWIDSFVEQELKLHRRGLVDRNPNILTHRRLLTMRGLVRVAVTSPEDNLLSGQTALEFYRENYLSMRNGDKPPTYLRPEVLAAIPEVFRDYYEERVQESLCKYPTLRSFYKDEFERTLPISEHTPVAKLPEELRADANVAVSLVADRTPLRNWGVEHPIILQARVEHMRSLYTRHFLNQARDLHFEGVRTTRGTPVLAWTALVVNSYPDQYAPFYRLVKLFYEELLDDPSLLERNTYALNRAIRLLIEERYRAPYEQRGIEPPQIASSTWDSFNDFLNKAREMPISWEARIPGVKRDQKEYQRLLEYLEEPKSIVIFDLDKSVTETDPGTGEVLASVREVHNQMIAQWAKLASQGVLIVIATNRRREKALTYAREILTHPEYRPQINPVTGGSFVEVYWGSGVGGMDAKDLDTEQRFNDFSLVFPDMQIEQIIQALTSARLLIDRSPQHVETLEGKINLYVPTGTEPSDYADDISEVLDKLGFLPSSPTSPDRDPSFVPLRKLNAGAGVVTIVPAAAGKFRIDQYVRQRYGLTSQHIMRIVDQPQAGGADEDLVTEGGVTVGELNPQIRDLISTRRALGQEGPAAALWIVEQAQWLPLEEVLGQQTSGSSSARPLTMTTQESRHKITQLLNWLFGKLRWQSPSRHMIDRVAGITAPILPWDLPKTLTLDDRFVFAHEEWQQSTAQVVLWIIRVSMLLQFGLSLLSIPSLPAETTALSFLFTIIVRMLVANIAAHFTWNITALILHSLQRQQPRPLWLDPANAPAIRRSA